MLLWQKHITFVKKNFQKINILQNRNCCQKTPPCPSSVGIPWSPRCDLETNMTGKQCHGEEIHLGHMVFRPREGTRISPGQCLTKLGKVQVKVGRDPTQKMICIASLLKVATENCCDSISPQPSLYSAQLLSNLMLTLTRWLTLRLVLILKSTIYIFNIFYFRQHCYRMFPLNYLLLACGQPIYTGYFNRKAFL